MLFPPTCSQVSRKCTRIISRLGKDCEILFPVDVFSFRRREHAELERLLDEGRGEA